MSQPSLEDLSGLGHRASKARQYLFLSRGTCSFPGQTGCSCPLHLPLRDWFQTWLTQAPTYMIKACKTGRGRWMNWSNWEGFLEKSHVWKGLELLAFAKMRIFRIPNPWNSHWCLQNIPWSNYFWEIQIKTDMLLHSLRFLVTMGCMFMEHAQKKVMVCGVGLAWASGLHGILALLPFSSKTLEQRMYHRRALWILWGPSLSCQQSLLPGHERTSLFSLRPHASLQIGYWLLWSSFGFFCRGSWTSFCSRFPASTTPTVD